MDTNRKVIVGYDLCEDFTQISCYSYKALEPIPISPNVGDDNSLIPTVLCIRKDTKLWLYGQDAMEYITNGEGILIDRLLEKIIKDEAIELYGQTYSGISLLEKYLRKTLTLVKNHFPTEPITQLVITIPDVNAKLADGIYEALRELGIEKDRAVVISHANAYSYFALSQDKSLWVNDVGLFDFNEKGIHYFQISINRRMLPMIASMMKKDFSDMLSYDMLKKKSLNITYMFENIANTAMHRQIISTIYFTGKGFDGGWADSVMKSLCMGRRVFMGQNLYTKGACYAAKELSGDRKLGDFILLTDEMILSTVSIRVYCDARMKDILLSEAAIPWYEVNRSIELIPDNETELEIIHKNIMTRDTTRERFRLLEYTNRPNKMTRLELRLTCLSKSLAKLSITDLGFGDFYPREDRRLEYTFEI